MKKLLPILLSAMLLSFTASAQFAPGTVSKIDTAVKPSAKKFAINKLDDQLLFWNGYAWETVLTAISDTATLDFASSGATTVSTLTKTMNGARLGDEVALGVPHASVTATGSYIAWVSAANTVSIRFSPKATEDPASGVFHISVLKRQKYK